MANTQNNTLTLELPEHLVDVLAQWASIDAELMEPRRDRSDRQAQRAQRADLADLFVRSVLLELPAIPSEGDLAAALKLRELVYSEHRDANPN